MATKKKRDSKGKLPAPLRRRVKTNRKSPTLLTGILPHPLSNKDPVPVLPITVSLRETVDRYRFFRAKTLKDLLETVKDVLAFWLYYEQEYPRESTQLLRTVRHLLGQYKSKYPEMSRIPTDWLGFEEWIPDTERALAGGSHTCALKVAVKEFDVSRATLMRAIKNEILKSYRPKGSAKSAPHIVDAREVGRIWGRRQ